MNKLFVLLVTMFIMASSTGCNWMSFVSRGELQDGTVRTVPLQATQATDPVVVQPTAQAPLVQPTQQATQVVTLPQVTIVPAGPSSQGACIAVWPSTIYLPSDTAAFYKAYETDPSQGIYTFVEGMRFDAPLMIVFDKLAGGGNDRASKRIVRGSHVTKANGGHIIAFAGECEIDNEM